MAERQQLDVDDPALRAAVSRWRRGEDQLYLTALVSADGYERSLDLVRRTVEHLRSLGPGDAALLEASGRGAGLVREALAPEPVGPAGTDLRLVADAALALRCREVLADQTAQRRLERLRAAREHGDPWVVLETSGDPEGDPLRPYRRLEAAVGTGSAMLVTSAPDADFTGSVHAVEAVRVDLRTGVLHEFDGARAAATTTTSTAEREQHAATLRGQLSDP